MNFENEKYEYYVYTWGQFYNKENKAKHGLEPGDFWFDTEVERGRFINRLRYLETKHDAYGLSYDLNEGKEVRYRTIAVMDLVYCGKKYPFKYDFGFGYPVQAAMFVWSEDGNYGCDCNKSLFLSRKYKDFQELDCGDKIKTENFKIKQIRDQ